MGIGWEPHPSLPGLRLECLLSGSDPEIWQSRQKRGSYAPSPLRELPREHSLLNHAEPIPGWIEPARIQAVESRLGQTQVRSQTLVLRESEC
jgi:hypothetical protein